MQLDRKAGLMLGVTFLLGAIVGAFGAGALRPPPPPRNEQSRAAVGGDAPADPAAPDDSSRAMRPRDSRFVSEMERFLAPRDEAQRAALRPYLLAADTANTKYVSTARDSMSAVMRRMRDAMAPVLDADQRQRLSAWVERPWDDRAADRRRPAPDGREQGARPPGDPLKKSGDRPPRGEPRP